MGGNVVGPASAIAEAVPLFSGTTGKLIKDSARIVAGVLVAGSDLPDADAIIAYGNTHWTAGSGNVNTAGAPVVNDFAKFTDATHIEGRSYAETLADLGIEAGATADQTGGEIVSAINAGVDLIDDDNIAASIARDTEVDAKVSDDVYGAGWNGIDSIAPSKNAVYDKIETLGAGYTNLTQFVDQAAWRLFHSNGAGDVVELALGTSGQYLKANGVAAVPTWAVPSGAGDVLGPATNADEYVPQWNGVDSKTLKEGFVITAAGKVLIDDADAAAQRTTLGLLSAALRNAEDTLTDGANLPDGHAIKTYGDANWSSGGGRTFAATYVVYKSGATYYAKANSDTGLSDYSGGAFHTVLANVLAAMPTRGGKIYFMPAEYSVTSTITGRSNVLFEGSGNHFGCGGTVFSLDANCDMFIFNAVSSEFEFSHINFDGNDLDYRIFNFNGTSDTVPIQDLAFTKCNFYHCKRAIYGYCTYDIHFTDVGLEQCGYGSTPALEAGTGCNFWHFKSCRWESLNGVGFKASGSGGGYLVNHSFSFMDCKFHGLDANRCTCIHGHLFYSRVVGCLFFNVSSTNRAIYNQDKGLVVSGNTFCCINGHAIELCAGADGCSVTGNAFGGAFGSNNQGNPSWILNNAQDLFQTGNSLYNRMYPLVSGTGTHYTNPSDMAIENNSGLYFRNAANSAWLGGIRVTNANDEMIGEGVNTVNLGQNATQANAIAIRVGGVNQKWVEVGAVDSGGAGYRMLRVLN
jgi:hypothetical protein